MKIKIMSVFDASKYCPTQKTYLISIGENQADIDSCQSHIINPLFVKQAYIFADIDPEKYSGNTPPLSFDGKPSIIFNQDIARTIITDFQRDNSNCLELLVHCLFGLSRSPAIAIALNEIFNFREPEISAL